MAFDSVARASQLLVLDARDIEAGPVARLAIRDAIPHGLHGTWVAATAVPSGCGNLGGAAPKLAHLPPKVV